MSKKQKTLALIIPAYNEEDYIGACLESIAAQAVKPDEVIVVDNNSTDRTAQIARSYPFVRVIKEVKQGRVFARDRGFRAARSDLIGRIDADTVLPAGWTWTVLDHYADPAHAEDTLTGGSDFYNLRFKWLSYNLHKLGYFRLNSVLLGFQNLFGSNMVVPKTVLDKVLGGVCRTNEYHEDIDLSIHIHKAGKKALFLDGLRVHVALRGVWTSREGSQNRFILWKDTLKDHGIRRLPSEVTLDILIFISSAFLGLKSIGRSAYLRVTNL